MRPREPNQVKDFPSRPQARAAEKDVLIAVFGMTGTGKTTLIKLLAGDAGKNLKIGHNLESCTQDITSVKCKIGGRNVILVDTPGFDDSTRSDTEILSLIAEWLQESYERDTLLSGILYLHRISDIRMSGSSIKNLRMFRKLCGTDNMTKVSLVTTIWNKVTPDEGERREQQLIGPGGFWNLMVENGSLVKRHDNTLQSAQELILDMLDNKPVMMKLQQEIVSGKALIDTDAGASINEELLKLQKQHGEELEAVREEMAIAMKQGNKALHAQLKAEHAKVLANLQARAEEQFQLQEKRVAKLEKELKYASAANIKIHQHLESQKEAVRRQDNLTRQLKDDVRSFSAENDKLKKSLVQTQNYSPVVPTSQGKAAYCNNFATGEYGCGSSFIIYGLGPVRCPYCQKLWTNDQANWNALQWA